MIFGNNQKPKHLFNMDNFKDQYNSEKWEKKRREIYRRDNWHCRICDVTRVKLNAHHLYYDKDKNIWDYDNECLVTLCDNCHDKIHDDLKKISGIIAFKIMKGEIDVLNLFPMAEFYNVLDKT